MKRNIFVKASLVTVVAVLLLVPAYAQAQQRSGVGLGLMIGQPTGISAISWLGGGNAVDLVAAWAFGGGGSLYLHADYQFHTYVDRPLSAFAGLGGFIALQDDPMLGLRVPLGLTFLFQELPIDVFVEIAPSVSLIPSTDFELYGGLGFRYYL